MALYVDTALRSAVGKVSLVGTVGLLNRDRQGAQMQVGGRRWVQVLCSPVFSGDKFTHKQMLKSH